MKTLPIFLSLTLFFTVSTQAQSVFLNETFFTGSVSIPSSQNSIFYWLFQSRNAPSTDPLVLWVAGGQGCSSEISIFLESGPYRLDPTSLTLGINPYSWNNVANVLYIDNPAGIGYSQATNYDISEDQVASDFDYFFAQFLSLYPEYKGRDVYLAGNSYTAHYIPLIAANLTESGSGVTLKSVLIGNGWIDPYHHYESDAKFAFQNELINQLKYDTLSAAFEACITLIKNEKYGDAVTACQATLTQLVGNPPDFDYYNINKTCSGTDCTDYTSIANFLGKPIPKLVLEVETLTWTSCSTTVSSYLAINRVENASPALGSLLNSGVSVVLYNGNLDLIVNWLGAENAATNVTWNGQQDFVNAGYTLNANFGEYKVYENFVFYKVYNAGHFVAMDQPAASLDVLLKTISSGWKSEEEISS